VDKQRRPPTSNIGEKTIGLLDHWQVFGLTDNRLDGSRTYRPSLPSSKEPVLIDDFRFRSPLRGSPGFSPEFPLRCRVF